MSARYQPLTSAKLQLVPVQSMSRIAIITIFLCNMLSGCGEDPDTTANWEHSYSGLFDAEISSDGRFAVVSSFNEGASFWDLVENSRLYNWRHNDSDDGQVSHIAFAPDNAHVITADARTFVVWNVETGQSTGYWSVDSDITDVAISNHGAYALLGLKDGRAIHVDQKTGRRLAVIAHRNERVVRVDLAADGLTAATGGNDGRVIIWNTITGSEVHVMEHGARIAIVTFDPSQQRLFSADERGGAIIWDLESGDKLTKLNLDRRQHVINAARFSTDGMQLVLGFPGRDVRLWDSTTGRLLKSWRAPARTNGWVPQGSTVYSVAFNDTGTSVIAESSNGLGRAWAIGPQTR